MSGVPLPFKLSEIKSYIDLFPVPDVEMFINGIYAMDEEWRIINNEKSKNKDAQKKNTKAKKR